MKTILVCGYGPGISHGVAKKFGAEGFAVALVARTESRVDAGADAIAKSGAACAGFSADLSDPKSVKAVVASAREKFGPITVVHWNAYGGGAGDLTTADASEIRAQLDVAVVGLVAAVQASLADFDAQKKEAAVLVTGGGLNAYNEQVDAMAAQWGSMGLAIAKAAQHKTAGLLHAKLKERGVYVGEIVVNGLVKGTAFDRGNATLDPLAIGEKFWELYTKRDAHSIVYA